MSSYLSYIFIAIFLVSLAAAILLVSSLYSVAQRQGFRAIRSGVEAYAKLLGALVSLLSLLLSSGGILGKIGILPQPDEGKLAIEAFYNSIQTGHYQSAYDGISRARLEEIRRYNKGFDLNFFTQSFATTRSYENVNVALKERAGSPSDIERKYNVTFDVTDEVPRNKFYEARANLLGSNNLPGIVPDKTIDAVIDNLREYYLLPAERLGPIRGYLKQRTLSSLFDPLLISEIARNIGAGPGAAFTPNPTSPSTSFVLRHFIQEIELVKEDGAWKIRGGLYPPRAVAIY